MALNRHLSNVLSGPGHRVKDHHPLADGVDQAVEDWGVEGLGATCQAPGVRTVTEVVLADLGMKVDS